MGKQFDPFTSYGFLGDAGTAVLNFREVFDETLKPRERISMSIHLPWTVEWLRIGTKKYMEYDDGMVLQSDESEMSDS